MYKNSVRYKPIPSAPFASTPSRSFGVPMLAATSKCLPSAVIDLAVFNCAHSAFCLANASAACLNLATSSAVGSMTTSPVKPSTEIVSPLVAFLVTSSVPTTAGISSDRAIIALCAVRPPISVTNALTYFLFNCAVSEGVRSCATTTTSSSINAGFGKLRPSKCAMIRFVTSRTSAARSCIYGLSVIPSNVLIKNSETSFKACSALTFSSLILVST